MSLSGSRKLVWFRMLKNSARNWNCLDSVTRIFLNAEKSQFAYSGPSAMLRPAVPNCSTGELGSCRMRANAFELSHALALRGPELGLCPATRFGRFAENLLIPAVGLPPEGQAPLVAQHEAVTRVEQRQPTFGGKIVGILRQVVLARHRSRSRPGHVKRGHISHGLRIGVGSQEGNPVAESL